jgi:membrane protein DedA with SNARE-associated domain
VTYFDRILVIIDTLPNLLIYLILGLSSFIENIFPPAPGDTFIAFGAFLVATQRLHFAGVYISTSLGSLAGFMFLFWIGGLLGKRFFIKRDYRFFRAEKITRAETWFRQYGYYIILINRFFPGIRSVVSITAGISRLQTIKVLVLAFLSCSVWNLLWIGMGYTLGSNWDMAKAKIETIVSSYNLSILILFGVVLLIFWIRKLRKH